MKMAQVYSKFRESLNEKKNEEDRFKKYKIGRDDLFDELELDEVEDEVIQEDTRMLQKPISRPQIERPQIERPQMSSVDVLKKKIDVMYSEYGKAGIKILDKCISEAVQQYKSRMEDVFSDVMEEKPINERKKEVRKVQRLNESRPVEKIKFKVNSHEYIDDEPLPEIKFDENESELDGIKKMMRADTVKESVEVEDSVDEELDDLVHGG
jgi:hypothetical protein